MRKEKRKIGNNTKRKRRVWRSNKGRKGGDKEEEEKNLEGKG